LQQYNIFCNSIYIFETKFENFERNSQKLEFDSVPNKDKDFEFDDMKKKI
jgi:hypothetical protein